MIKIKFENLLVSIVVSVVVFFNTISTTMLDRTFFQVKVNFLFLVVLLLGLRFLYKMRVSYKYLILSILLLLSGVLVYFQTNRLNFLVYSMLLVLLVNVDMKVVLRNYVVVAGILVVGVFLLSLAGIVPNLQYNRAGVIRNSFGFIYPTDFASHCFYLFLAISYLLKDKFIWTRSLFGVLLSAFIIKYCDARLNALSILLATVIFIYFYYSKEKKLKIFALFPYSAVIFASIVTYLSYKFSWSNPFLVSINKLITGRLALGRNAFTTFEVHLFGTRNVQFIGSGGKTESVIGYNYVDSSYVQMLFTYGIVPVVLLIVIYVVASRKQYKDGQYLFVAILSLIAFNCMIEAFWFVPTYNIFMFLLFTTNTFSKKESNDITKLNAT
ncbi:polysaccharide polymerase [Streptococcus infantis]|uniref:polysaccharide polymerase n=1 Tax=Streptococcus TaxID=1301 RepID=UPI001CBDC2DB|nr:polysaccharide polymerase [Streptococcus infantis]MBZ2120676.1 polysaccharide polymerase [Streptococcus infantis]MBZ2122429.1 polysaccharide polymerase [Streptococcus infantis]MBZ2126268.1 polysaccharide polymerase [Streptococcus infantis]